MAPASCRHFSLVALLVLSPVAAHLEVTAQLGNVSDYQDNYAWILASGIIAGFFMAWGIGANDVANSFATSVGSKALTLRQAVAIATVCEFVGCISMGASVTDTVRSGFIDERYFKNNPEVLQLGMLASLIGAGLWLALCSSLGSPVSTTHSIIGSLVGVSLVANPKSLNTEKLGLVVLSWLTSPLLSGIIAASVFLLVRTFILRSPHAVSRGYKFFPLLLLFTNLIFCMYVVFKNSQVELKNFRTKDPAAAAGMALGFALFFTAIVYAVTFRTIQRSTEAVEEWDVKKDSELPAKAEAGADVVMEVSLGGASKPEAETHNASWTGGRFFDQDLHAQAMAEGGDTKEMHDDAEKFPAKTEKLFSYLQVVSAAFDSLAHGANDVANSVGPLAAIVGIHQTAKVDSKVEVPIWILVLGGAGISIGLLTYGYNVIKSIGIKLTKITPSRGFSIEMGSSIVVIIGSNLGIPLSTTHCQVGATVGVGMCEIRGASTVWKGVNWRIMAKVAVMWVMTLVFAAICASSVFGILVAIYQPQIEPMNCGPIAWKIGKVGNISTVATKDSQKARFKSYDSNGDGTLDDGELKKVGWNKNLKGDKLVEKFGRRRRRTPKTMTEKDFLHFSCTSNDKLEHLLYKNCEPVCLDGFRANKELSCKINPAAQDADGNFQLATYYSGFSACVVKK
ncbi:unnamed protein product [Polarella glacialis]|uniref:Phosphate transporter n=1 Tax=Polarella glacialis TaxID=89957 RepID=A0A813IIN2_POLGL|nr:unnamed protein product [Polarella glacialis]